MSTNVGSLSFLEASEEVKRLLDGSLEIYDEPKDFLLTSYNFSPVALCEMYQRLQNGNYSYFDFAHQLKADILEWLENEDVSGCCEDAMLRG